MNILLGGEEGGGEEGGGVEGGGEEGGVRKEGEGGEGPNLHLCVSNNTADCHYHQ